MHQLIQAFAKKHLKKNIPDLRPGDTIKVHQKIQEAGKERVQVFEGIVIAVKGGRSISASFIVRKIAPGGIGVERTYPLHSPTIVKVERLKKAKVRRAKLYYLRNLEGKAARLKDQRDHKTWEEPEAEKELEKIREEQAMQAHEKELAKGRQQEELEKKFEQAKDHGTNPTPNSGQQGGEIGNSASPGSGNENSAKES